MQPARLDAASDLRVDVAVALDVDHVGAVARERDPQAVGLGPRRADRPRRSRDSPEMQARPVLPQRVAASRRRRVGPTSSSRPSTPSGAIARTFAATRPSSMITWSAPAASSAARLRSWRVVAKTSIRRSLAIVIAAMPDRRARAADQQRLATLELERVERAPGGAEALRDRAEAGPVERRLHGDHRARREQRVLRVAAVELAAHPAHRGDHALAARAGRTRARRRPRPRTRSRARAGTRTASPDPPARVISSERLRPNARTRHEHPARRGPRGSAAPRAGAPRAPRADGRRSRACGWPPTR